MHAACSVNSIRFEVVLYESDEGFAVQCPALPGCWSQSETKDEALDNIQDAIREYLAVARVIGAISVSRRARERADRGRLRRPEGSRSRPYRRDAPPPRTLRNRRVSTR